MESVYACRAGHTYLAWTNISSGSAENVRTEIEVEIITDMRWDSLLMSGKDGNYYV